MATRPIESPDNHFLNAAMGWMELGDYGEAKAELDKISFLNRFHPDVLIVRWKTHSRSRDWAGSLDVARALVRIAPERPTGWICLAYSLYNSKLFAEARVQLLTAEKRFPKISAIPYFLACLACQMGETSEASRWLSRWNGMVADGEFKDTARKDPRLKSVWQQIEEATLEPAAMRHPAPSTPPAPSGH